MREGGREGGREVHSGDNSGIYMDISYRLDIEYIHVHEKSGGPEQKGIPQRAVSSLLALSAVQRNLPCEPHEFIYPRFS